MVCDCVTVCAVHDFCLGGLARLFVVPVPAPTRASTACECTHPVTSVLETYNLNPKTVLCHPAIEGGGLETATCRVGTVGSARVSLDKMKGLYYTLLHYTMLQYNIIY